MPVRKNEHGEFEWYDSGPIVINGEEADKLLAEMDIPPTAEKRAFLEECERIYRKSMTGRHQ